MTKNTVKPGLRPKRRKRAVENTEFDAFARRILRAYSRRVASGDVEALRSLVTLSAELDAVTRFAVTGLRHAPYHYSWGEIADRLGTSRQAAQMRYGDRTERGAVDRRLLDAGMSVTVGTLVEVFSQHHPGVPASSTCPGCGYRYPDGVTDCPTNAIARPLLRARRNEDKEAARRLTPDQMDDLCSEKVARTNAKAARQAAQPAQRTDAGAACLFDLTTRGGA
jgi:hypothetical protein